MAAVVVVLPFLLLGFVGLRSALFPSADTQGARVLDLRVESAAVGEELGVDVVVPPGDGDEDRPLLVFLHGRSGSDESFSENESLFAALAALGERAPVIAFPDGGVDNYWHDREGGDWGRYVTSEVIPLAARASGADASRVAIGGISMGGFGAYDIALDHPGRFCAVGGHSPALWLRGADTAPGAFDDAEDFERNDVIETVRENPEAFAGIPIWNDSGEADPFLISDVAFTEALASGGADLTARIWPGGHDQAYWDGHWDEYLRFYARSLAGCR